MRRFVGTGGVAMLLVVLVWRGVSELLERRRELALVGELAPRVARRQRESFDRALERRGVSGAAVRAAQASPWPPRPVVPTAGRLARIMRAIDVAQAAGVDAAPARRGDHDDVSAGVPATAMALAVAGLALSIVPLVRPLGAAAPWCAVAGGALVLAAWLLARGR